MIQSWRIRWAGKVARMEAKRKHIGYWWESQKEIDHKENQDMCGRRILDLRETEWGDMDWIDPAQDME
jgi:hypothetical protein